jgi:hypothetical protein
MKKSTKGMLAAGLTVAAIAVGTLASPLVGVAQAYSSSNCGPGFDTIDQVDTFKTDAGRVDLGDGTQAITSGNHVPTGNALLCWGNDGHDLLLKTKLYWDSAGLGCAKIKATVRDESTQTQDMVLRDSVCSDANGFNSKEVVMSFSSFSRLDDIKIELGHQIRKRYSRDGTVLKGYHG